MQRQRVPFLSPKGLLTPCRGARRVNPNHPNRVGDCLSFYLGSGRADCGPRSVAVALKEALCKPRSERQDGSGESIEQILKLCGKVSPLKP